MVCRLFGANCNHDNLDSRHHIVSLDHNDLTFEGLGDFAKPRRPFYGSNNLHKIVHSQKIFEGKMCNSVVTSVTLDGLTLMC